MLKIFLVFTFGLFASELEVKDTSSHACFLQKPMILGASNSSSSTSAASLFAKSAGHSPTNVAVPGSGSDGQMKRLRESVDDVQSIIALDLFFWDPGENCSKAMAHAEELINIAKDKNKFLVLATLPTAMRSQECVGNLNQYIRQNCKPNNCLLADYDSWLSQIIGGQFQYDGKPVSRTSVFRDSLHLNNYGSRLAQNLMADELLKLDTASCPFLNKQEESGFSIEFDSFL